MGVGVHADEERIVHLAETLIGSALRAGDSLMIEPRSAYAYERIPKSEVEELILEAADLYYRPIWSFEYKWVPKDKTGFIEIDGLTGNIRQTNQLLPQIKGMMTNKEVWFDVGADTVELLVPGGGIAKKVARAVAERK